jgi:copper(I)-binding protein
MNGRSFFARTLARLVTALVLNGVAAVAAAQPLTITDAWARATPPGARTAAVYFTIVNDGPAERVIAAESAAARVLELHTHRVEGGLQRMVRLADVAVPAGETVRFEPGGLHVMLLDIAAPLAPGMQIELTLRFAIAPPVTIRLPVVDARTSSPPAHWPRAAAP